MATQKEEAGHSGIFLYPRPDNWCVSAPSPDHDFGLVEINICRIFVDSHLRMWEFHCSVGFFSLAFFLLHFLLSNQQRDLKDQLSYVLKVEPGNHQWFNKWRLREKKINPRNRTKWGGGGSLDEVTVHIIFMFIRRWSEKFSFIWLDYHNEG